MEFLHSFLIEIGVVVDPSKVAGRPDRFVPDNGIEAEIIDWGGEKRFGSSTTGDNWGEWVVAKPPTRVGENEEPPPLPQPAPLENGHIPFREG